MCIHIFCYSISDLVFCYKKIDKVTFIQPSLESILIERTQAEEEAFKKMLELKYQFINKVEKYVGAILFSQSFIFLKPFEWLKDINIFVIEMFFFFGILFARGFLEQYLTDIKFFEIKAKCKISFEKSLLIFTLDFALMGITLLGSIFIIAFLLIDFKIY